MFTNQQTFPSPPSPFPFSHGSSARVIVLMLVYLVVRVCSMHLEGCGRVWKTCKGQDLGLA